MIRFNRTVTTLATAFLLSGSLVLYSCSSSPDEEMLRQLNDLKEEHAALQKESAEKEQQKAALDREIAEKNAKLKKCNDDQQVVKQRLGK
jgi:septal ring factor EnvC (AmiA/AmiB activator)